MMDDGLDGWAARIAVCQNRSQVPLAGAPLRCGARPAGDFLDPHRMESGWVFEPLQRLATAVGQHLHSNSRGCLYARDG